MDYYRFDSGRRGDHHALSGNQLGVYGSALLGQLTAEIMAIIGIFGDLNNCSSPVWVKWMYL